MDVLVLLASLTIVTLGAEALVRGASMLALRAGVSALFVGLTVVGFGTSSPELAASLTATLRGSSDVSVGNVVGSNIFNIGVILGVTALLQPIRVSLRAIRRDLLVAMAAATVPLLSLLMGGRLSRGAGLFLVSTLVMYLGVAYRSARKATREERELALSEVESTLAVDPSSGRLRDRPWVSMTLVTLGLIMLVIGSRYFVGSAMDLAKTMGVSDLVIGLTVVSAGTSLPELVTSLVAAKRRNPDIAIGTVIGSNIFNVLGILGTCALVEPQAVSRQIVLLDTPIMCLATLALIPIMKSGGVVSRKEGVLLVVGYVAYVAVIMIRGS
jgi:cation:H+ antiporter